MIRVKNLYLEITNKCNFLCKHCQNNSTSISSPEFSIEKILEIVESCINRGLKNINITGGEPTIYKNFRKLIEELASKNITINILSNGYLIDRYMELFKKYKAKIYVQISLDGYDMNSFYAVRNNYKFNSIINNIKQLKESDIQVHLKTTLTKSNIKQYDKFINISKELGCPIKFNFLNPVGRGKEMTEECLKYHEMILFNNEVKEKKLETIIPTLDKFFVEKCSLLDETSCVNVIKITSDGEVFPCIGFRDKRFSMGNVNEKSLDEIFSALSELQEKIKTKLSTNEQCDNCMCKNECKKQCVLLCDYMREVHEKIG